MLNSFQQKIFYNPITLQRYKKTFVSAEGWPYNSQQQTTLFAKKYYVKAPNKFEKKKIINWAFNYAIQGYSTFKEQLISTIKTSNVQNISLPPQKQTTYQFITLPDGSSYEGSCLNGVPHLNGIQKFGDKFLYVGQFWEGKKFGKGKMIDYQLEMVVEGNWINNCIEGYAKLTQRKNGQVVKIYKGLWKRSKFHGPGTLQDFVRHTVYEGKWKQGQKCDKNGKMTYTKTKTTYKGCFMDKNFQGQKIYKKNGEKISSKIKALL